MRAVIYARYSTDAQREASIEDQVRLCRELAERARLGGGRGLRRPRAERAPRCCGRATSALLEDVRAGRFDVVVAEALDRLSRDQEHTAGLFKQLAFAGVRLVTVAEGEIGELHVGLKGTMNALFLKDLAQKTHRGLRGPGRGRAAPAAGAATATPWCPAPPDRDGLPERGLRRIEPAEAAIVRRIFDEYAAGRSRQGDRPAR